jgi:hypothetical protein
MEHVPPRTTRGRETKRPGGQPGKRLIAGLERDERRPEQLGRPSMLFWRRLGLDLATH